MQVYVVYTGMGGDIGAISDIFCDEILLVVSFEFCRMGIGYNFLPKGVESVESVDYYIKRVNSELV